jgi:hypothetical protein
MEEAISRERIGGVHVICFPVQFKNGVGKSMVDNPWNNITIVSRRPIHFSMPQVVGTTENDEAYT